MQRLRVVVSVILAALALGLLARQRHEHERRRLIGGLRSALDAAEVKRPAILEQLLERLEQGGHLRAGDVIEIAEMLVEETDLGETGAHYHQDLDTSADWVREQARAAEREKEECSASTSVGAISAAWLPLFAQARIAARATTVLPEPTSPWSRRAIGVVLASSPSISVSERRCAAVSAKGRDSRKPRTVSGSAIAGARPACASRRLRRTTASCTASSSSKASLRSARRATA